MSVSDGDTYPYLANGAVTVVDASEGKLRYTPSTNNAQSFTYTASDGNGGTDSAEVTVDVNDDCGKLTVQVEGPNGNLVPGAEFAPEYDSDADGGIDNDEQLPTKAKKFTYNVPVSEDPRLSRMNESLMQNIPAGYVSNIDDMDKDVEETASGDKEPDDFWYPLQDRDIKQSKLATNASSSSPPPPGEPTAVLECEGSQDQSFAINCQSQYGQDAFAANFIGDNSTDPDNDIETYDWASQSGSIDKTTNEPVDDIQYCVNTADQSDMQDKLDLTVTDANGNTDSDMKQISAMCPIGGGGGCSEVSVQSDFTGDSLDTNSSAQRGANDQSYTSFDNGPKTATLDVSSVLDSGETAGDLTISFAESTVPPNGFTAEVDCDGGIGPEQCGAEAEIDRVDTGTQLRFIDVTGDPNPVDEVHDVSDVTTNVSAGNTVELRTDTYSGISQNHNSEASAEIMVEDITLEVCN